MFTWIIDAVRIIKPIRTQTKGTKPLVFGGGNDLAIYTFLADVEYQVRAHYVWNEQRPELADDRNPAKHNDIAHRMLDRGGRQDIFLGTRDCQGYVEPCPFGSGPGHYDGAGELAFGLMFHGFDYPDETGENRLNARFWRTVMRDGVIRFEPPEAPSMVRKFVRDMTRKEFARGGTLRPVEDEAAELGVSDGLD
jgi:CRISPR-associated protein Cas5d